MTVLARFNGLDSRVWSTATWSAPFTTQLVLALVIATSWLLGKWLPGTGAGEFGRTNVGPYEDTNAPD